MKRFEFRRLLLPLAIAALGAISTPAAAAAFVQCPGDTDGDGVPEQGAQGYDPDVVCKHLSGGDGFIRMADRRPLYMFGFSDLTGPAPAGKPADPIERGLLAANFPAPTIELRQGNQFYLTLTNVGMSIRPDLFDPHSVHFHGFPNQAPVFDGMPEGSFGINQGASLTYYYNVIEPGTYMYHCHVEATEHMQMGMLGQLFVRPAQDGQNRTFNGRTYNQFAYNDGDGSTGYHKGFPLQLASMDHNFHDASWSIQPLPFANMKDTYAMINGRGYPDTVNPLPLRPPRDPEDRTATLNNDNESQKISALVSIDRATEGTTLLLRISNLSVTNYYTVTALGLPMRVVGGGAHIARGPSGTEWAYDTSSVTLGGGESVDVVVETANVPAGTYFFYTTNLNYLSNNDEDYGGMMTEIVVAN